ncbi:tRNA(Met) cytidine acetate ligase [Macrococcus animalis]|uniref:tRNA(Met) cytidine acetate ligase n=1 Tax=Macrococcus animalis TaxID=3395467 RepID=UPI0039BE2F05
MKSIGIICEYNPFHNGHKYHIEQIKKNYPNAYIVAIMSGQFVQRGEPAFINKFIRTEMALDYVDLVVEIPLFYAASYADDFARGGITIAKSLGLEGLSFGSESGKLATFDIKLAQPTINDIRTGAAYPKLMDKGLKSNDILAQSYMKAKNEIYSALKLIPVKRYSNEYLEVELTGSISSATAIRKNYFYGVAIENTMPRSELIHHPVRWEDYYFLLKYRILSMEISELAEIYTMYEGLENRLKKVIGEADTFDALINKMVSKRYTRSRIQRLLVYVLLNIKEYDVSRLKEISAVRVLGMNDVGREFIKTIDSTEVVTNVNKKTRNYFEIEIKATEIYNLISGSKMTDFNTPVIYKK